MPDRYSSTALLSSSALRRPGTGVIKAAFSTTSPKSTSPHNRPSTRLIPTSITVAPSFIQSFLTIFGHPQAANQNIRLPGNFRKIAGFRMNDRYRTVVIQQQRRQRFADNIRTPDNNGMQTRQIPVHRFKQMQNPRRRCRDNRPFVFKQKPAGIKRRKTVHVLFRANPFNYPSSVNMFRQRRCTITP